MNHSRVLYEDWSFVDEIVDDSNLVEHIRKVKKSKPNVAFFVNAECVQRGHLCTVEVIAVEHLLAKIEIGLNA